MQRLDQSVVLVAHCGMGVFEDGLSTGRHGFVGDVLRRRVLVHGDGPARLIARVYPKQLAVGDRHRQHDVGEQRVDHDHVVEWVPLVFGNVVQVEDCVEREDQPVMRSVGVEDRAVAARDGGERLPVHRGEMVVLGEGVGRELPIDRRVQHFLAQWRPPSDAPRVEFIGQRSQVGRHVQCGVGIQCHPEEPGELGGG